MPETFSSKVTKKRYKIIMHTLKSLPSFDFDPVDRVKVQPTEYSLKLWHLVNRAFFWGYLPVPSIGA